jgi:hypothetical protein
LGTVFYAGSLRDSGTDLAHAHQTVGRAPE